MKRIYLFGIITRIFTILSFLFMISLFVGNCIINGIKPIDVILILLLTIGLIFSIYQQFSFGIFIKQEQNRIYFRFGFSKEEKFERVLDEIKYIEIVKENYLGFLFIIHYKTGYRI